MGKPIVVLNCGSSSIKFALFDGDIKPLQRKPLWAGQVDGIGGERATLRLSDRRPVALELGNEAPYQLALRHVRLRVERETGGHPPRARAALALYARRIVREIGALAAVLGGVDMLAFTAGVGEHSAVLRERICRALAWLGLDSTPKQISRMPPRSRVHQAAYASWSNPPTKNGSRRRTRSPRAADSKGPRYGSQLRNQIPQPPRLRPEAAQRFGPRTRSPAVIENVVTGQQHEFSSGAELLDSLDGRPAVERRRPDASK